MRPAIVSGIVTGDALDNITLTSNGKRDFVPRDQVSSLLVVYCLLFLPSIITSMTIENRAL